jgi:hypothetical protein
VKIADLKDGYRIEVKRPVTNPKADKRERYDPGKIAWTVGDVWRVKVFGDGSAALEPLNIQATPRRAISTIYPHHEGFEALIDACDQRPESATDVIHAAGCYDHDYARVLNVLLAKGFVSAENLRAAATEVANEE